MYIANSSNQFDGTSFNSVFERTGLAIVGRDRQGNPKIDMNSVKLLGRVYPKVSSNASVNFYFAYQDHPEGAINWSGAHAFDPSTDEFIDTYGPESGLDKFNGRIERVSIRNSRKKKNT